MKIIFTESQVNNFWNKTKIGAPDKCWNFFGTINSAGYGSLTIGSRTDKSRQQIGAHRFSYYLSKGEIAKEMVIHHKCANTLCVNPNHLEQVTQSENVKKRINYVSPQSKKTHCPKGHEYSEKNTRIYKGRRNCQECSRIACRNYYSLKNGNVLPPTLSN